MKWTFGARWQWPHLMNVSSQAVYCGWWSVWTWKTHLFNILNMNNEHTRQIIACIGCANTDRNPCTLFKWPLWRNYSKIYANMLDIISLMFTRNKTKSIRSNILQRIEKRVYSLHIPVVLVQFTRKNHDMYRFFKCLIMIYLAQRWCFAK